MEKPMKSTLTGLALLIFAAPAMAERGDQDKPDLDTDGDGYVSQAEWGGAERKRGNFSDIDTDGDGLLSKDERSKAREAMRDRARGRRNR